MGPEGVARAGPDPGPDPLRRSETPPNSRDPKPDWATWTWNGLSVDQRWTRNGPKMGPKWTKNGPEMDQKWTKNGSQPAFGALFAFLVGGGGGPISGPSKRPDDCAKALKHLAEQLPKRGNPQLQSIMSSDQRCHQFLRNHARIARLCAFSRAFLGGKHAACQMVMKTRLHCPVCQLRFKVWVSCRQKQLLQRHQREHRQLLHCLEIHILRFLDDPGALRRCRSSKQSTASTQLMSMMWLKDMAPSSRRNSS